MLIKIHAELMQILFILVHDLQVDNIAWLSTCSTYH